MEQTKEKKGETRREEKESEQPRIFHFARNRKQIARKKKQENKLSNERNSKEKGRD